MDPIRSQNLQGHILFYCMQDHEYSILVLDHPTKISYLVGHSVVNINLAEGLNSIITELISELSNDPNLVTFDVSLNSFTPPPHF
ncbi:hypothetical protein NPIL_77641 [Nephila pilipes]|uniref:Uncharacterized protein n=1 Tax=Nephila pilipes TaxID=299642 RepID=A0A8X6T593_NEPPI|nr:hypothetical protein NPIL_319261 [Nephila pilipes]GFS74406.1 hypothetical protein NPIL_77641 [Nephila pilipes]